LSVKITARTADGYAWKIKVITLTHAAHGKVVQVRTAKRKVSPSLRSSEDMFIGTVAARAGYTFNEAAEVVDLVVHTKSPEKWLLIDRETGQTYQGSLSGNWDKMDPRKNDRMKEL